MSVMANYYAQLVGFTVTGFEFEEDEFGGAPFPVYIMSHPDGAEVRVTVSRDSEGNGGGYLFMEEVQ